MNPKNNVYTRALAAGILIALAYAVVTALLLSGVFAGKTTFFKGDDITIQSYAWLTKVFAAAREGKFALWSFGTMSGVSFIGELQTAPLYPLALLWAFVVTPGDAYGLDLFIALHFYLGALGMHALGRTFGLSHLAAAVGAIVFSFGGTIALRAFGQPNIHAGLVYMPFVMLAAVRATRQLGLALAAWSAVGGVALAMTFLAGHAYGTVHALMAAAIAAAMVAWAGKLPFRQAAIRLALVFSILGAVALLVSAPQIVATGEYLAQAYKWYGPSYTSSPHIVPYSQYAQEGLSFADLATIFTGEASQVDFVTLFVTWTAVFAIVVGVLLAVAQRRRSLPLEIGAVIAAVGLVIALSAPYRLGEALYHVPLLNIVRTPARAQLIDTT